MKNINKVELHEIFQELKNNKDNRFNELYSKYNKLVYSIAFSILKNKENSEDIMQKVFSKIWELDKEKLPTNNEASWLYSITKNETLNYLRANKNTLNLEEIYYISSEDKDIKEIIEQDSYNKIISRLNAEEQEIVSLKILSNLSFKEIAQILNKPLGTIQWKYYKSLHTLKILISNLSMFMVAIASFIIGKTWNRKKSANIVEDIEQNEMKGNQVVEQDTDKVEEANNNMQEITDKEQTSMQNEVDSVNNETIENIIILEENTQNLITYQDIGILSIAGITLIITIVFSIIYIKCQKKQRRKLHNKNCKK